MECWEDLFTYHRDELRADVLKAAHHGSETGTSSGVLVNVRPKTFIISCGRGNEFGHPREIVLKLVEQLGAKILRTDEQGTIRCVGIACTPARSP
jgi:competence protein ComEC